MFCCCDFSLTHILIMLFSLVDLKVSLFFFFVSYKDTKSSYCHQFCHKVLSQCTSVCALNRIKRQTDTTGERSGAGPLALRVLRSTGVIHRRTSLLRANNDHFTQKTPLSYLLVGNQNRNTRTVVSHSTNVSVVYIAK